MVKDKILTKYILYIYIKYNKIIISSDKTGLDTPITEFEFQIKQGLPRNKINHQKKIKIYKCDLKMVNMILPKCCYFFCLCRRRNT